MGRRRAEEKFLCVNEIKNATSIIRRSINRTLPKDATLNSKFKSVPSEVFSEKTQHTLKMADANEHTLFQ